jgi:4-hydroxybenzoyl-CoA reductase subunit beta
VRLPKFEYFEPRTMKEAVAILRKQPSAKVLAGGTDLLVNMKHRIECPPALVNIKRISELAYLKYENGYFRIGALTTLKRIAADPLIGEKLPVLVEAAAAVGSYHHQVMGTLGGNICQQNRCKYYNQSQGWRRSRPVCFKAGGEICHVVNQKEICYSSYCGDMAPALLVLDARLVLTGPRKSREIAAETFYSGNGKKPLKLNQAEILTGVVIPAAAGAGISSYVKYANRASIDFPIVGTAFWASLKTREYRVAFTAVDRKPVRGRKVEAFLAGKELSPEVLVEAAGIASKEASPVKTSTYAPADKRRMMGILLQRAAENFLGRSTQ